MSDLVERIRRIDKQIFAVEQWRKGERYMGAGIRMSIQLGGGDPEEINESNFLEHVDIGGPEHCDAVLAAVEDALHDSREINITFLQEELRQANQYLKEAEEAGLGRRL